MTRDIPQHSEHAGVFPFSSEYKTWKQIGSTERIENNTIRVFSHDLAVKQSRRTYKSMAGRSHDRKGHLA